MVEIAASDKAAIEAALTRIKQIAFPPTVEIGEEYEGKVKTIMPYGAFVEVLPGIDGLLHVSELDWKRVENVEDVLTEGEMVKFKVVGRDLGDRHGHGGNGLHGLRVGDAPRSPQAWEEGPCG